MARATLILAKNITEANSYAKLFGLQRFTYRAVRNAGAIRGVRNAEVHILPSFLRRPDRHQILSALRLARTLDVFYVDPADLAEEPTDEQIAPLQLVPETDRVSVLQELSDLAAETEKPQWQKDLDAQLEPEGFELADPADQAAVTKQILESAAAEGEKVLAAEAKAAIESPAEKPKRKPRSPKTTKVADATPAPDFF